MAFQRLAERVRETCNVQPTHNKNKEIQGPVSGEKAADVLAAVATNPHDSTRVVAVDAGIGHMTVWRLLTRSLIYAAASSIPQPEPK